MMGWTEFEVDRTREAARWHIGVVEEDICDDGDTQQGETGEGDEYGVEVGSQSGLRYREVEGFEGNVLVVY